MKYLLTFLIFIGLGQVYGQSQSEQLKEKSEYELYSAKLEYDRGKYKSELKTTKWPITIDWEGNNVSKIKLLRSGVLEETFEPDVPNHSSYFFNSLNRISITDGVFLYYKVSYNKVEARYLLSEDKSKLENIDANAFVTKIKEYQRVEAEKQKGAKVDLQKDINASNKAEAVKFSLEGKSVKSISIKWLTDPAEIGMQSKIEYGLIATLADGRVFKTPNLGGKTPFEDFKLTCNGAEPGVQYLQVNADTKGIVGDKITLTVRNRFNTSISTSSTIKITYSTPVSLAYTGADGCGIGLYACSGCGGGNGKNVNIKIQNDPSGNYVLYAFSDPYSGKIVHNLKMQKGVKVYLDVSGGKGCFGKSNSSGSGGKGGKGGKGGDVKVTRIGAVTGENLIIHNSGGKGGRGGKGAVSGPSGRDGQNGRIY